jgi:hypothetical protein
MICIGGKKSTINFTKVKLGVIKLNLTKEERKSPTGKGNREKSKDDDNVQCDRWVRKH